ETDVSGRQHLARQSAAAVGHLVVGGLALDGDVGRHINQSPVRSHVLHGRHVDHPVTDAEKLVEVHHSAPPRTLARTSFATPRTIRTSPAGCTFPGVRNGIYFRHASSAGTAISSASSNSGAFAHRIASALLRATPTSEPSSCRRITQRVM